MKFIDLFCVFDQSFFSERLLQLHSMVHRGIVVSTGKFGTRSVFDVHQDGEVRKISKGQFSVHLPPKEG